MKLQVFSAALCALLLFVARHGSCSAGAPTLVQNGVSASGHASELYGASDEALLFQVSTLDSRPVARLCPGANYHVTVTAARGRSNPQPALTITQGSLQHLSRCSEARPQDTPSSASPVAPCLPAWTLSIPCSASGVVTLSTSTPAASKGRGHRASLSLRVQQSCRAPSCADSPPGGPASTSAQWQHRGAGAASGIPRLPQATRRSLQQANGTAGSTVNAGITVSTRGSSAAPAADDPAGVSAGSGTGALAAALPELAELLRAMDKVPVQATPACNPSPLGYTCSRAVTPTLTLHWSLGGAPPSNPCTRTSTPRNPPGDPTIPHLHIAATAPTTSYFALAFSRTPRQMPHADAAIAAPLPNNTHQVTTYYIRTHHIHTTDRYPPARDWLTLAGVSLAPRTLPTPTPALPNAPPSTDTTICLSRPLHSPTARARPTLHPTKPISMLWGLGRHGSTQGQLRYHMEAGGFTVNVRTGRVEVFEKQEWWVVHGVAMTLACCVLVPASIILARHKWLLQGKQLGKFQAWFAGHVGLQVVSLLLFVGASVLGLVDMAGGTGPLQRGHRCLGIGLMAVMGAQLLGGLARPAPGAPIRPLWLALHRATALAVVLGGFLECFLGVLIRRRKADEPHLVWLSVLGGSLVACLIADTLLSLLFRYSEEQKQQQRDQDPEACPGTPTGQGQAAGDKKHTPQKAPLPRGGLKAGKGGKGGERGGLEEEEEGDWALSVESSLEKLRFVGGVRPKGLHSRFIPVPPLVVEGVSWEGLSSEGKGSPAGESEGQQSSTAPPGSRHSNNRG